MYFTINTIDDCVLSVTANLNCNVKEKKIMKYVEPEMDVMELELEVITNSNGITDAVENENVFDIDGSGM